MNHSDHNDLKNIRVGFKLRHSKRNLWFESCRHAGVGHAPMIPQAALIPGAPNKVAAGMCQLRPRCPLAVGYILKPDHSVFLSLPGSFKCPRVRKKLNQVQNIKVETNHVFLVDKPASVALCDSLFGDPYD